MSGTVGTSISSGPDTIPISVGGTLTAAGSLVRRVAQALGGAISFVGTLIQRPNTRKTGTLRSPARFASSRVKYVTRTGTLTSAGTVSVHRIYGRTVSGTLSPTGAMSLLVIRQPVPPAPEGTVVGEAALVEGTLLGEGTVQQAALRSDERPPEFVPRSG